MRRLVAIVGLIAWICFGVIALPAIREDNLLVWWWCLVLFVYVAIFLGMEAMPKSLRGQLSNLLWRPVDLLFERWTGPERERQQREITETKAEVFPLPVEEVRRLALEILADPDRCRY